MARAAAALGGASGAGDAINGGDAGMLDTGGQLDSSAGTGAVGQSGSAGGGAGAAGGAAGSAAGSVAGGTTGDWGTAGVGDCGDIESSTVNCGRCGHDCGGGACVAGTCQPFTIAPGINAPHGLTVDADHVYFTVDDTVQSCPSAGCGVASSQLGQGYAAPGTIVSVGANVIFAEDGLTGSPPLYHLLGCPKSGCASPVQVICGAGLRRR